MSVGLYMGRVHAILKFYKQFCNRFDCSNYELDDQRAISQWCPNFIKLDKESLIFYNYNLTSTYNTKNGRIFTPDKEPCIVHGAGNSNLHPIAKIYGYNTLGIRSLSMIEAYGKRIPIYIQYFYFEIFCLILGFILCLIIATEFNLFKYMII